MNLNFFNKREQIMNKKQSALKLVIKKVGYDFE